jgi:hypothetical protein
MLEQFSFFDFPETGPILTHSPTHILRKYNIFIHLVFWQITIFINLASFDLLILTDIKMTNEHTTPARLTHARHELEDTVFLTGATLHWDLHPKINTGLTL